MAETDDSVKVPDNVRLVVWREREFWALEPDEGQVLAMVRMGQMKPSSEMTAARMLNALNRVPKLVDALLARDEDKDWFEDSYMDKSVKVEDLPDFCVAVLSAWWIGQPEDNRAGRRAAKKVAAKKATATRVR